MADPTSANSTWSKGQGNILVHGDDHGLVTIELRGDLRGAVYVAGAWADIEARLGAMPRPKVVRFEAGALAGWDSLTLALLSRCGEACARLEIEFRMDTLPHGLRELVCLANAVPEKRDARKTGADTSVLSQVGDFGLYGVEAGRSTLAFIGDCALAFGRMLIGRARFRRTDFLQVLRETSAEALPIVALINFLVGLILGFVGAVQLSRFGASIYVADLVGVVVVREMGALMTGIIICGRTGAAFAAQLGTMKVNEEIDAYEVFGLSPVEFLVLPRLLALILMMPLLVVFADLIGLLGGFTVAAAMLHLPVIQYWNETIVAVNLTNYLLGLAKAVSFGTIVAVTGCLQGIQCGTNAAAVGRATTTAVVSGITCIIVADALFAVLCDVLRI